MDNDSLHDELEIAIPLYSQIADILRRQIISGELVKDQKISERYVSQKFNVSTAPAKAAIRELNKEGLLCTYPQKGTFVSDITSSKLIQIIHLRSVIEGTAAYWGTINITEDKIDLMEKQLVVFKNYIQDYNQWDEQTSQKMKKANYSFHKILSLSAQNSYVNQLISNLDSINNTFRHLFYQKPSLEEGIISYEAHERIFHAVKNRNPDEAERETVLHIRETANAVIKSQLPRSASEGTAE